MAWVVDTSVVLDLITADPVHELPSTACLEAHLADGLVVCPVTFVEIGPAGIKDSSPETPETSEASPQGFIWWSLDMADRVAPLPVARSILGVARLCPPLGSTRESAGKIDE